MKPDRDTDKQPCEQVIVEPHGTHPLLALHLFSVCKLLPASNRGVEFLEPILHQNGRSDTCHFDKLGDIITILGCELLQSNEQKKDSLLLLIILSVYSTL